MSSNVQTVAVLGASNKRERYSYKAIQLLLEHGHETIPIHPTLKEIDSLPVVPALNQIDLNVDTLTVYVNPYVSAVLVDEIIALSPGRVIFNPGAESLVLAKALDAKEILYQEACTLVLLSAGQF